MEVVLQDKVHATGAVVVVVEEVVVEVEGVTNPLSVKQCALLKDPSKVCNCFDFLFQKYVSLYYIQL